MNLLAVAVGGAVGASARYLAGRGLTAVGLDAVWAIGVVNVVGAATLGYLVGAFIPAGAGQERLFLFLAVGVLGGFTTFSTWTADIVLLWEEGRMAMAVAALAVPPIAGVAAVVAGLALGRS